MSETLGQVLDKYLKIKAISAYRLAKLTDLSEPTLSGIRNDRHGASLDTIKIIAKVLDAPIEEFLRAAGHGDLVQIRQETGEPENLDSEFSRLTKELGITLIDDITFSQWDEHDKRLMIEDLRSMKQKLRILSEKKAKPENQVS